MNGKTIGKWVCAFAMLAGARLYAYDWPSSGTATIPAGERATITAADVAKVQGLDAIVLGEGSSVTATDLTGTLALSAAVSGSGAISFQNCEKVVISGDNSGLDAPGHFAFDETVVEIRSRYGLGDSGTGATIYDRGTVTGRGSLDFYGTDGIAQNDVPLTIRSTK